MRLGYLTLFRWRGIPVRAHWTVPLGALLFTGMAFAPVAWLAFLALILVHEAGHAVLVRRYGHSVAGIDVTGFGGLCHWSGYATERERAVVAWGGVLAQAVLFGATSLLVLVVGFPRGALGQVTDVFLRTNAWLIALNLLPIPPLDGAEAWGVFRFVRSGSRFYQPYARVSTSLRSLWSRLAHRHKVRAAERPAERAPSRELADALRRVADDARAARRGG